jgi:hypothetical protein
MAADTVPAHLLKVERDGRMQRVDSGESARHELVESAS